MKPNLLCVPCLMKQAYNTIQVATDDKALQFQFLKEVGQFIVDDPFEKSPADYCTPMYLRAAEMAGNADVYSHVRQRQNENALALLGHIEAAVRACPNPLIAAARIAGAGNLIDSGIGVPEDVERALIAASERPFGRDESEAFFEKLKTCNSLIYLCDNAGEIVFDWLFVKILKEYYPHLRVIGVVKGSPIINDATMDDAKQAGFDLVVDKLITSGRGVVGTPLRDASSEFLEELQRADLFLCKGQGNFESLDEEPGGFLMLTAKCPVVADELGILEGEAAFIASGKKS
jgi:damage-control phosphatase, subfamily I